MHQCRAKVKNSSWNGHSFDEVEGTCDNYIEDDQKLCNYHLLAKYNLFPVLQHGYNSPEAAEMAENDYAEGDVIEALRRAERESEVRAPEGRTQCQH